MQCYLADILPYFHPSNTTSLQRYHTSTNQKQLFKKKILNKYGARKSKMQDM